jgi:hypothetical protein
VKLIICEGACNPSRPAVDAAAESFRRACTENRCAQTPPADLVRQLRAIRHTVHQRVPDTNLYACATCGAKRRYGAIDQETA